MSAVPIPVLDPAFTGPSLIAQARASRVKHKAKKSKRKKALPPLNAKRPPNDRSRVQLNHLCHAMLDEGLSYHQAVDLMRTYYLHHATQREKGNQAHAAKKLKVSREYINQFLQRGKDLL